MKFYALATGIALATLSSGAKAELIERTFDIAASDFELISGSATPTPVDPVELNFTVIFNTSGVTGPTTDGLTINSFTLPNPPYASAFTYDGSTYLTVATYPLNDGCLNPANSYCVFITDAAGASPYSNGFIESTSSGGYWVSQSTVVTASGITIVPESSTWALMLVGFGGIGWLGFRRCITA